MLYFSKLRIIFITIISLFFVLIAFSNFIKFENNFFDKKINLGLDLQGGSYLLLEIDNEPVIEQKLQNLTILKSTALNFICFIVDIIDVGIIIEKEVPIARCIIIVCSTPTKLNI